MEMFSALLALCEGNPPVTSAMSSPTKSQYRYHSEWKHEVQNDPYLLELWNSCPWEFFLPAKRENRTTNM